MTKLAKIEEAIREEIRNYCGGDRAKAVDCIMSRITPLLGAGVGLEEVLKACEMSNYVGTYEGSCAAAQQKRMIVDNIKRLFASAPSPPSEPQPEEMDWPTEPGRWERLDTGSIYEADGMRDDSGDLVLRSRIGERTYKSFDRIPAGSGGKFCLGTKWRRLPSASSDELARLRDENEFLQRQVEAQRAKITQGFENQTVNLRARIAALEAERDELQKTIQIKQQQIGDVIKGRMEARAERDAALSKLAAAEQVLQDLRNWVDNRIPKCEQGRC